jgi:peroxiredoxin
MTDKGTLNGSLEEISAQMPPEIGDRISASLNEVRTSGVAPGLAVGERAPVFALPDARGNEVSLADRLASGPVVLVFYRGEWCPYCNTYLRALQAVLPDIRKKGASLIAVSPQSPDHSLSMADKAELEFDVLSDATQQAIREYRLQFELPDDLQAVHRDVFELDLRLQNADGSWNLPVPATFVINRQGTVVSADVGVDYRRRMEPSDLLAALDRIT